MRKALCAVGAVALLAAVTASPVGAAPLTVTAPTSISIATPFAPGCGGATEGNIPGANFNYPNSETEPWVAVSPTKPGWVKHTRDGQTGRQGVERHSP